MGPVASKKATQIDGALLLPAVCVAILYTAFVLLRGLPGAADLKAKELALANAQAAAVSPEALQRLQQEQEQLKQKFADVTKKLVQERSEAELLARKESAPLGRIDVVTEIENLFNEHGLRVTRVRAASDQSDGKLAAALQKATGGLLGVLSKSKTIEQPVGPPVPLNFEDGPAAFFEAQGASSAQAPPLDLRELEIRGDYQQMLSALQALAASGGESVVVSVGFERPESSGARQLPLIWRLILHVQPGSGSSAAPTSPHSTPADIPRLASEREPVRPQP